MPPFKVTPHYSPYFAEGEDTLWVVLTVKASSKLRRAVDRAEVVIIDNSGSMGMNRKLEGALGAARAAIDALDDGVELAVLTGNDAVRKIWPADPQTMAVMDDAARLEASSAISRVLAGGGTRIGDWLTRARTLFDGSSAGLRHAIILSDGVNTAGEQHLHTATEACRGVFQCDCRGFGTDWSVAELRYVAETLGGRVGAITKLDHTGREQLAEHFRVLLRDSQAKAAPSVRLRVLTRAASDVVDFVQSTPTRVTLTERGDPIESPRATEFVVGGWAPREVRDYTLAIKVRPSYAGRIGERKIVAKIQLVLADGSAAGECPIEAEWTDDQVLSTQIVPIVTFHRTQSSIPDDIQAGYEAKQNGDLEIAAGLFWRARETADDVGNSELVAKLDKVVGRDGTDPPYLKPSSKAEDIKLNTDSSMSMRFYLEGESEEDEDDEDAGG